MNQAQQAGMAMVGALRSLADGEAVQIFGPTLAPLSKLVGRWRFQIVLRGRDVPRFRRWLDSATPVLFGKPVRGVRTSVDVDPRNLL